MDSKCMEEDLVKHTKVVEDRETVKVIKLIVVRHAESIGNVENKFQGKVYDTELTDNGNLQAKLLAQRLQSFDLKRIISSPAKRTRQTAQHVADLIGREIEISEQIAELNHGLWEGRQYQWVLENDKENHEVWTKNPSKMTFPGGDVFIQSVEKTLSFLEDTVFDADTLIVSHDNIIRPIISLITNTSLDEIWNIPLERTALNIFEVNRMGGKNKFRVIKLNDKQHLINLENRK